MEPIKLMLVDAHKMVRGGLRMLLEAEPDISVVSQAVSCADALEQLSACLPDVIVLGISLPGMDGPAAVRALCAGPADTPILTLMINRNERGFLPLLEAGAAGCLPMSASPIDLVGAVRIIYQGHIYLHPSQVTTLVREHVRGIKRHRQKKRSQDALTPRQRQVLTLIAAGLGNAKIAERLEISVKTVARHRENIMARLNLSSYAELIKYAIRKGLTEV